MGTLAGPIERAIAAFCRLPGIGRKTAQRLVLHLLEAPAELAEELAGALVELREKVRLCRDCFNLADAELCPICEDPKRDRSVICVVEDPADVLAFERTGSHRGLYHVLGGALSPLKDVGPDQIRARELVERCRTGKVQEVILATDPDVEGEATAVFLGRLLKPLGVRVTRLAQGVPAGSDLDYADDATLQRAMEGRREY